MTGEPLSGEAAKPLDIGTHSRVDNPRGEARGCGTSLRRTGEGGWRQPGHDPALREDRSVAQGVTEPVGLPDLSAGCLRKSDSCAKGSTRRVYSSGTVGSADIA